MKRALKKRVKAVLNNNPSSDDAPVELLNVINPKVNRRVRTKAAMIGLAISMGATSLLVTRQSDQAQAAVPVGSQKATSTIPSVSNTEVKFASTKLESQAISSASVPENPVIVEPTAVSQVPGLEAKWQVAANGMSLQVPASATFSQATPVYKNSTYLKPQIAQGLSNTLAETSFPTVNKLSNSSADGIDGSTNASVSALPQTVATSGAANSEINAQLKAQQEFALNRLQEKSNRLRKSLAQLRSGETKNLSQADMGLVQPTTVAEKTALAQSDTSDDATQANLISRLKQNTQTSAFVPATPTLIASSTRIAYEVKPGDTLAAIASRYKTSVSELARANNLSNPNELQISQKLIIPAAQVEATVATKPTFVESSNTPKLASYPVNIGSANSYLPAPQSPTIADNSSITVPTPVIANKQIQANSTTDLEIAPTPATSYAVGGDTPVPKAFGEMQPPKTPANRVARANNNNNDRLRGLQAEIQRLQQKYRAQQSGNLVVPAATETNNAAMLTPVSSPNNFTVTNPAVRPNSVAIQIPVPTPMRANFSAQPIKSQFRATIPANDPINPDFLPSLGSASQWTPSSNPSGTRVTTPSGRVNTSDSLGKMRGRTVSPQVIPPLAAVDQYLPRQIDELTPPPSSSSIAYTWPAKGTLTSGYGWRWGRMHKGIDVANSTGTPVVASAEGTVEKAGWNKSGYGILVQIRHPDGSTTRYAHNSKLLVQAGQQVSQGDTIALMGSTGHSTGPHTHFEIHPSGKGAVNPIAMLPDRV